MNVKPTIYTWLALVAVISTAACGQAAAHPGGHRMAGNIRVEGIELVPSSVAPFLPGTAGIWRRQSDNQVTLHTAAGNDDATDARSYALITTGMRGVRGSRSYHATASSELIIDAFGPALVTDGAGTWQVLPRLASPVTLGIISGPLGNARYYIYAFYNAGTTDFIITDVAPDANLQYESGGTTRAYVGTFVTDPIVMMSGGFIKPFRCHGGLYLYTEINTDLPGISSGTSTVFADVDLDPAGNRGMPPHGRIAYLYTELTGDIASASSTMQLQIADDGGSTPIAIVNGINRLMIAVATFDPGVISQYLFVPLVDLSSVIQYKVDRGSATILLKGFIDEAGVAAPY